MGTRTVNRTKARRSLTYSADYEVRFGSTGVWQPRQTQWFEDSVISDRIHRVHLLGKTPDEGGIMQLERKGTYIQGRHYVPGKNTFRGYIQAGFMSGQPAPLDMPNLSETAINALGASAVARVSPTASASNPQLTLGELLLGAPKMVGSTLKEATSFYKKAGDEFLNIEFGWKPFLDDVKKFASTVRDSDKIIRQYIRDSGRSVRRRYVFPPERQIRLTSGNGFFEPLTPSFGASVSLEEEAYKAYWFSGSFKYYVPIGDDALGKLDRHMALADRLYGIHSPSQVWELAPWSWAVDWFSNTGDVIKNIEALGVDGLVMERGYMMAHEKRQETLSVRENDVKLRTVGLQGVGSRKITLWETKRRYVANPFGFGILDSSLSEKQIAILAALGLSRGR